VEDLAEKSEETGERRTLRLPQGFANFSCTPELDFLCSRVYSQTLRYMQAVDSQDAEDLAQDVVTRVIENLGDFRGKSEAAFFSWAATIARNLRNDFFRARQRTQDLANVFPPRVPEPNPEEDFVKATLDAQRQDALHSAIAELPEYVRTCMDLRLREGLSHRQIATRMRLRSNTVKSYLHMAKHRLKQNVRKEDSSASHQWENR
jgi:RNA polymerase sigma-70 factor (ECF subfamily)